MERADRRCRVQCDRRDRGPGASGSWTWTTSNASSRRAWQRRRSVADGSGASGAIEPLAGGREAVAERRHERLRRWTVARAEHTNLVPTAAELPGQPQYLCLNLSGNRQAVRAHHADAQTHGRTVTAQPTLIVPTRPNRRTSSPASSVCESRWPCRDHTCSARSLQFAQRLDALGDGVQAQRACHLEDRPGQRVPVGRAELATALWSILDRSTGWR